jgi:hypothetical protein
VNPDLVARDKQGRSCAACELFQTTSDTNPAPDSGVR